MKTCKQSTSTAVQLMKALVLLGTENRKIGSRDVMHSADVGLRTAQRLLKQLADDGYAFGDGCNPQGFKPTQKTLDLFGVKS